MGDRHAKCLWAMVFLATYFSLILGLSFLLAGVLGVAMIFAISLTTGIIILASSYNNTFDF